MPGAVGEHQPRSEEEIAQVVHLRMEHLHPRAQEILGDRQVRAVLEEFARNTDKNVDMILSDQCVWWHGGLASFLRPMILP